MQSTSATFFISQTLSKIVWSQNSPFLAGGTCDGQENYVKIWQCSFDDSQSTFDDPFVVGSSPIQGEVTDLKWVYFDNEDIFLCSTSDGQVLFFKPDPEQDNMLVDLGRSQIINSPISCFDVSLENPQIACGGENGQLLIFNLNLSNPRLTKKCDIGSGVCLNGVKFLSSNLVVAGNSRLQFWDTRTHQSVKNVPGSAESIIETISAHPSQKEHTLATGHSDGTVNIWDMRVDRKIMTHRRHENHVWKVDFHQRRPNYVISCSEDGSLLLWDTNLDSINTIGQDRVTTLLQKKSNAGVNSFDIHLASNGIMAAIDNQSICLKTQIL